MLAAMGAFLELKADLPNSEALQDLKPLVTARQACLMKVPAFVRNKSHRQAF
jgi:hypothetical protein